MLVKDLQYFFSLLPPSFLPLPLSLQGGALDVGLRPTKLPPLQISITAPKKCLLRHPFGAVIHKGEKGKRGGREEREKVAKKVGNRCQKVH